MKQPKLTAGYDSSIEIISLFNEPYVKKNGTIVPYDKADKCDKIAFMRKFIEEKNALPSMITAFHKMEVPKGDMYVQWLICNFGGENSKPDYDTCTHSFNKEYWDCGNKEICPGFGIACRNSLTNREFQILQMFNNGTPDKLIADILKISENTVRDHRRKIFKKFKSHNKQEAIIAASNDSVII